MLREKSTETELSANTIEALSLSQKQQNRTRFKVFLCFKGNVDDAIDFPSKQHK